MKIVFRSLIVEMVAHLVADDGADAAIVDRGIGVRIEERRLQDRGGKHDLVHHRVGVGVDLHRGHAPLGPVDRLIELVKPALPFEAVRGHHVGDEIVAVDL